MGYRRRKGIKYSYEFDKEGIEVETAKEVVMFEWTAPDGTIYRANTPEILDRRKKQYAS